MNKIAKIGDNNPPDPLDEITAPFDDFRAESENWLDGKPVETEAQMDAVDALRKEMRKWRIALEAGQKDATAPLHDIYKAELERWKPTIADAKRYEAGLVGLVDEFKRKLVAEKEAARKAAWAEAETKRKAAEVLIAKADVSDLSAVREAQAAADEANIARAEAEIAQRDKVKGLRTVTRYRLVDPVLLARHLWTNDREAQDAFHIERATKLGLDLPGIFEKYTDREAY